MSSIVWSFGPIHISSPKVVPVFDLNFYLMGKDEIEDADLENISKNIAYLNEEFEGLIKFELNQVFKGGEQGYIPNLRDDHLVNNQEKIENLIQPVEVTGAINVFLFDTYVRSEKRGAMLGFTPILGNNYEGYAPFAPEFDRLFVAYKAMKTTSTLVHEMGHFFNLKHPWELGQQEQQKQGINERNIDHNHMNYHPKVDEFTREQLNMMVDFALKFRSYLVKRMEVSNAQVNDGV